MGKYFFSKIIKYFTVRDDQIDAFVVCCMSNAPFGWFQNYRCFSLKFLNMVVLCPERFS
jgi:hypothetical protein